jgi:acetylornithine deacetylase/succinyl-diaminopimelate desuccinylase-like protein
VNPNPWLCVLLYFLPVLLATPARAQSLPPPAQRQLAREIFAELIAINTTVDSGATRAAQALARRLTAGGFPATDVHLVGPKPHKQNLVVRLRGRGKGEPILFLAHLDVVEARREDWSLEPFQLTERDGHFYGRGTSDIKDEAADLVANLLRLKAEKYKPQRDIIVALTDDEEGGEDNGVAWLLEHRPELIRTAYVINTDAGGGQMQDGRRLRNPVQTSEKIYATYFLEVTSAGGHSSLPPPPQENAIYTLARSLDRVAAFRFPIRLNESTRSFFTRMAEQEGGQLGTDLRAVVAGNPDSAALERLARLPLYNSAMRNTCVATMLEAGHAENALPERARATIQCRLLPDQSPAGVRDTLVRVVADSQVRVTLDGDPQPSPPSPLSPEVMKAVERATAAIWPGVVVLPVMDPWSSDGGLFRRAGIPVYGVSGVFLDFDDYRAHGKDERVEVRAFYEGVEFMYRLMRELSRGASASGRSHGDIGHGLPPCNWPPCTSH